MSESPDFLAETKVLLAVAEAMKDLDDEGKKRIYKLLGVSLNITVAPQPAGVFKPTANAQALLTNNSPLNDLGFEDIAAIGASGIEIIAPDLKASTKKDASLRIAFLVCYLTEKMMGNMVVTKDMVYEQMKKHAAFDENNTRNNLKKAATILKIGNELKLSVPGKQMAEKIIAEIRDSEKKGAFSPGRKGPKSKKQKSTKPASGK